MRTVTIIFLMLTLWIVFGSLLTLAIIYDGIYIQLLFDLGLVVITGAIGFFTGSRIAGKPKE